MEPIHKISKSMMDARKPTDSPAKKRTLTGCTANPSSTSPALTTRMDSKLNLFGHNRGINDVTFSPTALYIATASDDKTLRLWSAETGDAFVEFRGHTNFVFSCKFNPQSNLLVSGVSDYLIFSIIFYQSQA